MSCAAGQQEALLRPEQGEWVHGLGQDIGAHFGGIRLHQAQDAVLYPGSHHPQAGSLKALHTGDPFHRHAIRYRRRVDLQVGGLGDVDTEFMPKDAEGDDNSLPK